MLKVRTEGARVTGALRETTGMNAAARSTSVPRSREGESGSERDMVWRDGPVQTNGRGELLTVCVSEAAPLPLWREDPPEHTLYDVMI